MKKVYADYFQKSKVFLYPLLNIKKGIRHVPAETYVAWEGMYELEDCKFLCLYNVKETDQYSKFEEVYLLNHNLFENYYKVEKGSHLYVYDYSEFKYDLNQFKLGKYSKFSLKTKDKILKFFGDIGTISEYIQSYIHPADYHDFYAEQLGVSSNTIEEVYELCSKPDMNLETLKIKLSEADLFQDNLLSLENSKSK